MWRPGAIQHNGYGGTQRLRCNVTAAPCKPRHKRLRPFALLDDRDVSVLPVRLRCPDRAGAGGMNQERVKTIRVDEFSK
jgi:hypothetical protein